MFKRIALILSLVASIALSAPAAAAKPELFLNSILDIQPNERSNDEIYLTVTARYSDGEFESYTVPKGQHDPVNLGHYGARFPAGPPSSPRLYWIAKGLKQVKNIPLWTKDLKPGQGVQLVISIMEHDMPPWNLDDLIGSLKIDIGNQNGKIDAKWTLLSAEPTRSEGSLDTNKEFPIILGDGEGHYQLKLMLK